MMQQDTSMGFESSVDVERFLQRPSFEVFVKPRAILASACITLLVGVSPLAHAAGEIPQPATSSSASSSVPNTLPDLPKLAPIVAAEADPGALQDLDKLLERLTAPDAHTRDAARTSIAEVTPSMVAAVRTRLLEIRGSIDRKEAQGLLDDARKAGRKAMKGKDKGEAKPAKKKAGEILDGARDASSRGDFKDALKQIEEVVNRGKKPRETITLLEDIVERLNPRTQKTLVSETYQLLALAYMQAGRPDDAQAAMQRK
jgi:hypothetical protein